MFRKRKETTTKTSTTPVIQGRPSLRANVMGRGKALMTGMVKVPATATMTVATTSKHVVQRATKVVVTDPLAMVATHTTMARQKIFPSNKTNPKQITKTTDNTLGLPTPLESAHEKEYLSQILSNHFLFGDLTQSRRMAVIEKAFERKTVPANHYLIRQGESGDYFYVLYEGTVVFEIGGEVVGTSSSITSSFSEPEKDRGAATEEAATTSSSTPQDEKLACFGELALLFSAPRAASVRTETQCTVFQLDRVNFRTALQQEHDEAASDDQQKVLLLKQLPILKGLDSVSLNKLVSAMTTLTYSKGETLLEKGEAIHDLFVVQSGKVLATDITLGNASYADIEIGPGEAQQSFGWRAMIKEPTVDDEDESLVAHVVAMTDVTLLAIDGETFQRVLGKQQDVVRQLQRVQQLNAVAVFRDSKLEEYQLTALVESMKVQRFRRTTKKWIREGTMVEAAMGFVRKGSVVLKSESETYEKTLQQGAYFGQEWMLADQNKEVPDDAPPRMVNAKFSVTVQAGTELDVLSLEEARKIVNTALLGLGKPVKVSGLDGSIQISDLHRHTMLGAGSYGQVWLVSYVKDKPDKKTKIQRRRVCALKIQSKYELIETGQAEGVVSEVNIMKSMKSPFIIRLYSTFQDRQRVYMLTSLLQGGELEAIMGSHALPEDTARFYAAGILEGLTYMHRRHIIHRDLKPENVLINSKGYPVLIDLGFAKYVPDKTDTFCGTPMYIAPEVVRYKGHDKGADHWSWACLVFEMITAKYPFYVRGMPELQLFKKICSGEFKLYGFMSFEAKLLVMSLLIPDPAKRLGARANGWQDLYEMPFFRGFDFEALRKQQLPAPWVPQLKDPLDASNFNEMSNVQDKMEEMDHELPEDGQDIFKTFGKMTIEV